MSAENGKVCCNCRHNKRYYDEGGMCYCECEIKGVFLSYQEVMAGWCRRWAREKQAESEGGVNDAMDAYMLDYDDYDIDCCQ